MALEHPYPRRRAGDPGPHGDARRLAWEDRLCRPPREDRLCRPPREDGLRGRPWEGWAPTVPTRAALSAPRLRAGWARLLMLYAAGLLGGFALGHLLAVTALLKHPPAP